MRIQIERSVPIARSVRVQQVAGLFDVPVSERSLLHLDVSLPIEEKAWSIGLIVGPSGSGKSTVAQEIFKEKVIEKFEWPTDRSILDGFPDIGVKEIVQLLNSVGFSSPPSWLRPYHVLSTGEKFRCDMARLLAEQKELAVMDEYTSVVDRTVAEIGSAAIAKTVRKRGGQFVAVTCHEDILPWLQPDWVYRPGVNEFSWRSLQRRPPIELRIVRVHHAAWELFKHHHYLSADLNRAATCFVGFVKERPAAFCAVLSFPHRRTGWRAHRTVCLPDFQGVGIGNAMNEYVASLYRSTGKPYYSATSHPAMIAHRKRSPLWRTTREPGLLPRTPGLLRSMSNAVGRLTAGFEFVGQARVDDAKGFGIL